MSPSLWHTQVSRRRRAGADEFTRNTQPFPHPCCDLGLKSASHLSLLHSRRPPHRSNVAAAQQLPTLYRATLSVSGEFGNVCTGMCLEGCAVLEDLARGLGIDGICCIGRGEELTQRD